MILLHALLLFSILLPALPTSDRSQALSRINEARTRMLSNRAKLRANSGRLTNHGRPSMTNRSKRQYAPESVNGPYLPPPQPTVNQNFAYEDPVPELIHICSIEDDEYARSAESDEESHDFHPFDGDGDETLSAVPRMSSGFPRMAQEQKTHFDGFPKMREGRRENENFGLHGKARAVDNQWLEDFQAERPLNRALEELSDVRQILNRFQVDSLREAEDAEVASEVAPSEMAPTEALPTETVASGKGETGTVPTEMGNNSTEPPASLDAPRPWSPTPEGTANQRGGIALYKSEPGINSEKKRGEIKSLISEGGDNSEPTKTRDAEADAHVHSRFHQHSLVHSHGKLPISPTYIGSSGFHLPQAQLITPGLNLNINQNQNVHPGLHQPTISHSPYFSHGVGHSISHSLPSQSAIISTHTQPGFHARDSEAEAHRSQSISQSHYLNQQVNQNSHPNSVHNFGHSQNIHSVSSNRLDGRPHNNFALVNQGSHIGSFRDGEETLGAAEGLTNFENEEPNAFLTEEEMSSWSNERKASPTHKKKSKKMKPQYYQAYPSYGSYYQHYGPNFGSYREAGEEEDNFLNEEMFATSEDREASPTHHKKTHKKPQYSNRYREAEESDHASPEGLVSSLFEEREASPTHKKKQKFTTVYYPVYNKQPQYYGQSGHYREAEETEDGSDLTLSEDREASPTHHKKKKKYTPIYAPQPHYYPQSGHYREAEDNDEQRRQGDDGDALEDLISSNFLFDFPARRRISEYKRSTNDDLDEILGEQRQIVDSLQNQSKNDEDLKLIADITNRTLTDLEEKRKKITKRSIPFTRLISDPRVKLDVPQTVENFGTATKNAFEDERAPMYHLKHIIGSSKNAILSAMRIPPQNMIVPSDYEIVKTSERDDDARSNVPDDDHPFSHTFKKVGQMVRNGIKSGQETAGHIGEVAYSAKNVLNTARHSAPRLIIPYSQIPAIQDTRKKRPNKAILITPRILDLAEETSARKASGSRPSFVRLGHLVDAVGLSKPNSKNLELQKIVFEPRGISEARVDERLAQLYSKFRNDYDDVDTVSEAISTLEDATISVGAKNLRDFLVKMRGELTNMVKGTPSEHKKKKPTHKKKKQQETREMGQFIETLFDGSKEQPKNEEATGEAKNGDGDDDVVGDRIFLPPELLHPFMGRASQADLKKFLQDNGDENLDKLPNTLEYQKEDRSRNHNEELTRSSHDEHHDNSDLGYVLGAINPMMFERLYNQTVKINKDDVINPEELFQHQRKEGEPDGNGTVGTSFDLTGPLWKPFMGEVQPQQIEAFLDTYNKGEDSGSGEDEE